RRRDRMERCRGGIGRNRTTGQRCWAERGGESLRTGPAAIVGTEELDARSGRAERLSSWLFFAREGATSRSFLRDTQIVHTRPQALDRPGQAPRRLPVP